MLNEYYQNIGIKGFIRRYGLVNAFRRGMFMANPIHKVKDYEVKKLLWQDKISKRVDKYLKYATVTPKGILYSDKMVDEPIWVYWDKGIEEAPIIVKKCYESILRYGNRPVILLTEKSMSEYIEMPADIEKKKNSGQLPLAIYVDLMRFSLLSHYGGTWIDATVYLTDEIPMQILESDFWVFHNSLGLLTNPVLYPVWFIHAKKDNETMTQIRNIAFAYWSRNNHIEEYLLSNIIFTKVITKKTELRKNMFYLNSDYSEYLIRILGDEYSKEKWDWIKKLTGIHKLTYKLDASIDKPNSIYRWITKNSGC